MQVKDIIIPYKISNPEFKLYCFGDQHLGTIHCVEKDVQRKVDEIKKSKNTYWIGMGDYAEFITPRDKRFDPNLKSIADWVEPDNIAECQTKRIVSLFEPIKHKCIGLLYGNHEDSMRIHNHDNVQKNICDRLGVDNLGFSAFVRFFFRRENSNESHIIKGAFTHGASSAITEGAKTTALKRFMNSFDAHIYGYAHVHSYKGEPKAFMTLADRAYDQSKIKSEESMGALTGCWFRTYTQGVIASYGERKVYPPTEICCAMFVINAHTGEVDVHRSK